MKSLYFLIVVCVFIFIGCKNNVPSVAKYYTAKSWDRQYFRIPLYEPLSIQKEYTPPNKWIIVFDDLLSSKREKIKYSSIGSNLDSINFIGANKGIVYGYIDKKLYASKLELGQNGVIDKNGTMYFSTDKTKPSSLEVRMELIDSINGIFLIPKRWFIINSNDTSFNFIFKESEYKQALIDLNINESLYNINDLYKQYSTTGILPWFPDRIKALLK